MGQESVKDLGVAGLFCDERADEAKVSWRALLVVVRGMGETSHRQNGLRRIVRTYARVWVDGPCSVPDFLDVGEDGGGWDAAFFEELAGVGVDGGQGGDIGLRVGPRCDGFRHCRHESVESSDMGSAPYNCRWGLWKAVKWICSR